MYIRPTNHQRPHSSLLAFFFFLFCLFYFFIRPIFFFSREREREAIFGRTKKLSIRPLTIYFSQQMKNRETRNLALPDDPDQQIRYDFFLFLLLFPPYQPSTRNCVTHFQKKKRKANKRRRISSDFPSSFVWADAGGRSNLIDGWMWWWWWGGGFIFQFVIDVCNRRKKKGAP
jgi:hypothetical protein